MKKPSKFVMKALKRVGSQLKENSPAILIGVSVLGVVTVGVMATRAGYKANDILTEVKAKKTTENPEEEPTVTKEEIVVYTWKEFVPVVAVAGVTIAAAIGSYKIQSKKAAMLAALYSTAIEQLESYQKKTEEVVGTKKAREIKEAVNEDKMLAHVVDDQNVILTGHGNTLFFDPYTGQMFRSSIEHVRQSMVEFSYRLLDEMKLPYNEWLLELGLDSCKFGDDYGWAVNNMGDTLKLTFDSKNASNGEPVCILSYNLEPKADYRDMW